MGLFDQLGNYFKDAIGPTASSAGPALASAAFTNISLGDLQGLLTKLQQGGLGEQVKSWLGNGPNLPITSEQLHEVLGTDQIQKLAEQLEVPAHKALDLFAEHLPAVVDKASPGGALQDAV